MYKKISLFILLFTFSFSSSFIEDFSEESRIQSYIDISKNIKSVDLNLNKEVYLDNLIIYINKNKIKHSPFSILERRNKILNNHFIYKEKPFKFNYFIKQLKYNFPKKERLAIIKNIILEKAEDIIFVNLVRKKLIQDCFKLKIINKKIEKENNLLGINSLNKKKKIKKCFYEKLTVNGKRSYFKAIEKKVLKYYILEELYFTQNYKKEKLNELLEFYKSKEYQSFYKLKEKYTLEILVPKIEINIKKEKKSSEWNKIKKSKLNGFDYNFIDKKKEKVLSKMSEKDIEMKIKEDEGNEDDREFLENKRLKEIQAEIDRQIELSEKNEIKKDMEKARNNKSILN